METSTVIEASIGAVTAASSSAGGLLFPAVSCFERVDAEGLLEASPPRRGDEHGVAVLDSLQPAEIEVARGDGGPHRTRDVWTSLGPVEAESAKVAERRTPCRKLDPELGEKPGAGCCDFGGLVVEHDILASGERIGEINAEAAGQVVIADSGRTQRARLPG